MKVYRISATQSNVSFSQNIEAFTYQDAENKFYNQNKKLESYSFPFYIDDLKITKITRRY